MHRNEEHYPDPTFAAAYMNMRKNKNNGEVFVPWVYIASPLRGDIEGNIQRAKEYCRFVIKQKKLPLCPHIYFTQFLNDRIESERRIGMLYGIHMLKRCKELWVFGDRISEGMQSEIKIAKDRNMPIRYFDNAMKEVL
ncbi:MAG: DUF4406 domain-containing protein [Clostridia bacterium]|nr:DUF4406 domain-containing protein [Clostridia bacterium]